MNCVEVQAWLIAARQSDPLPKTVRRHLRICSACRRSRRRLRRLDAALAASVAPDASAARERLLDQLRAAPSPEALPAPRETARPRARAGLRGLGLTAAALLAGFAIAWRLFDRPAQQVREIVVEPPAAQSAKGEGEDHLLGKFADYSLLLSNTDRAADQLAVFSHMAADLRQESLELARCGRTEDLPNLVALHDLVLRRGLMERARCLTDTERRELIPEVVRDLETAGRELDQALPALPPDAANAVRPAAQTAHALAALLTRAGGENEAALDPRSDDERVRKVRDLLERVHQAIDRIERDILLGGGDPSTASEALGRDLEQALKELEKSLNLKKEKKDKKDKKEKDKKDKKEKDKEEKKSPTTLNGKAEMEILKIPPRPVPAISYEDRE